MPGGQRHAPKAGQSRAGQSKPGQSKAGQSKAGQHRPRPAAVGGSVEGSFLATGVVPRMAEDLAARGGPLDSAVFRRDRV